MKRLLCLLALFACLTPAPAQPPAAPVNPQAPTLAPVLPLGMQRGTTLDVTLSGTNLADPTGVWTSFPAKVTIPGDANNGKTPTALRVRIEAAKDAPLGFHAVRVATRRGLSNARLFCLDELPQVAETAGNQTPKTAQPVQVPCVVVGRADAEVTDYFKIAVKANQRLSFEVLGRRLGSSFDPQITLLDAATGRELPGGHSNDAPGLQTDARLHHLFKADGEVLVAVRDVSYRGGADFHYRLRVGDFPCATATLPLAVKRGSKTAVRFAGPQVEGVAAVEVPAPADPAVEALAVTPRGPSGLPGWPVPVALSDLDETLEKEPNNEPAKATRLTLPAAVTGRFEEKDDLDHYVFTARKGQRLIVEAQTGDLLTPTEVYLVLRDAKGTQVAASNPQQAARLDFTPPADGDYTLSAEHLHAWGGPEEVYRLTVTPFAPGFSLTLNTDRWDVAPGGSVSIPLFLTRSGYDGPIEVTPVGAAGISGSVTIPAGPAKPANQPSALLELKAADLPPGPLAFTLQGKATINGQPTVRLASARSIWTTALAGLPVPPHSLTSLVGLAVTEKPPFTLTAKLDAATAAPGKPITATVTASRTAGFTAEIAVSVQGLPAGAAAPPVKIAPMQTSAKLTITLKPNVKVGQTLLTLQGAAKHDGRDWAVRTAPLPLVVKK